MDESRAHELGRELGEVVRLRLKEPTEPAREPTLRLSAVGKPHRQVWYDFYHKQEPEPLTPDTRLKFLFGDMLEILLVFLCEESGHKVTDRQLEVEVDGVKGHIDGKVDGELVDFKSASPYGFKKFENGALEYDDPFGYVKQLGGYSRGLDSTDGGSFIAIEKSAGHITRLRLEGNKLPTATITSDIAALKEVVKRETPPERCYEPKPDGKSGNLILPIGCSYCRHKFECHSDANDGTGLRAFYYSTGPKYFTSIKRTPDVPEITTEDKKANN